MSINLSLNKQAENLNIDFNKELNPEQLEVVFNGDGPCLVLAGAGSGKTRTLVYRVVYLLSKGIPASSIMLLTFTNKASREMLDRVELALGGQAKGIWGGTFHHIGNRLLRIYGKNIGIGENFTILDEEDSLTLLKNSISQANPPSDKYFPKARVVKSLISLSANLCCSLDEVIESRQESLRPEYRFYLNQAEKIYQQRKKEANSLDFDDLLVKWRELLESDANLRSALGRKFSYILVDEYQDTNYLQSRIINNLAEPQNNVLVVGDDSQSIYGFRGADVSNILDFPKVFKNAKTFHLDTNYRSTPEILKLANHSIKKNINKFEKELKAVCASGLKPVLVSATDNYQQAQFVAQKILDLQSEENYSLNDIAVLFRSHFQSLELEMELNKRGIPYQMRGGLRFFEQAHLKDVIAYLKIISNFKDEVAWLRLLEMQAGIGSATADKICREIFSFSNLKSSLEAEFKLSAKAMAGWRELQKTLKKLVEIPSDDLSELLKIILVSGYEKYLQANFENYRERLEDLDQLIIFVSSYNSLAKFLSDTALSENFRSQDREQKNNNDNNEQVILSTIHQAKGLEWRAVFLIGLADGLFPHARTYEKSVELEEERRLFYVATTRAKEQLYLTYPLFSRDSLLQVSPFIKELPAGVYQLYDNEISGDESEEVIYVDETGEYQDEKIGKKRKKLLDFDCELQIEELDF